MEDVQSGNKIKKVIVEEIPSKLKVFVLVTVYCSYLVLYIAGHIVNVLSSIAVKLGIAEDPFPTPEGYAPLFSPQQHFWLHRIYRRCRDLFERPLVSVAGGKFLVAERVSEDMNFTYKYTGKVLECLNLGSYNYLGYAQNSGPIIDSVSKSMDSFSFASASPVVEGGRHELISELEKTTARFVGKEAAMVFGMGWATNSTTIPCLVGKGTLIVSDCLNHNSIVTGCRSSPATIRTFKHNDTVDLERVIRCAIAQGQPRTRRPWKKIIICVEGIYSMEGDICRLPEVVEIKKKYKTYLYVDEAHSIGALGERGRGVCQQTGVNPADVDILMGTFTKAFGSVGGYIASEKSTIEYLRVASYGQLYASAMSPPCAQQALEALKMIMGEDGTTQGLQRVNSLHENCNYFRDSLREMGFDVLSDRDSPIVIMMVYHPDKVTAISRELLKRGIAVVVVGYPVTSVLLARLRFCVSACHSRADIDYALKQLSDLGDVLLLKHGTFNE